MKNNNYLANPTTIINKAMQKTFVEKGHSKISQVNLIYSLTKTKQQTTPNLRQESWIEQDFLHQNNNNVVLSDIDAGKKSPEEEVALLKNFLESLINEMELYSESLNYLPNQPYPLANYIIQSFLLMQQKLDYLLSTIRHNEEIQNRLQTLLSAKFAECSHLNKEIAQINIAIKKKSKQIKGELETSRRETQALRALVKSLKKNKKQPSIINYLSK